MPRTVVRRPASRRDLSPEGRRVVASRPASRIRRGASLGKVVLESGVIRWRVIGPRYGPPSDLSCRMPTEPRAASLRRVWPSSLEISAIFKPQKQNRPHASTSARSTGVAGCYGPRAMIEYGVECPFCVHRSRSFSASPRATDVRSIRHAWSRPRSVIPAQAGIQLLPKTAPNSSQKDALEYPECSQTAFKLAPKMH